MDLKDFSSGEELWVLIREINNKYYSLLNTNILYLEELGNTNYCIIYMIELRDAYSHFLRIFDYDFSEKGRGNIKSHLSQYIDHLQNGLFDTYRKILNTELILLRKATPPRQFLYIRGVIDKKAALLRIMDESNSPDQRIQGYRELMEFISKIRHGLYMQKDTVEKLIENLMKP